MKCLCMCAKFQFPMRKCDLQLFVREYVVENSIETRWEGGKHGKEWIRYLRKRWVHRVKVKKPTNIKRSRAMVSPLILKKFFNHLAPNIEGVHASHIVNYYKTNLMDDPGKVPSLTYSTVIVKTSSLYLFTNIKNLELVCENFVTIFLPP
jgi:hypothetical protein